MNPRKGQLRCRHKRFLLPWINPSKCSSKLSAVCANQQPWGGQGRAICWKWLSPLRQQPNNEMIPFSCKGGCFYTTFTQYVQRERPKWQQKMLSTKDAIAILFTQALRRAVAKSFLPDKETGWNIKAQKSPHLLHSIKCKGSALKDLYSSLFSPWTSVTHISGRGLHSAFMEKWGGLGGWSQAIFKRPFSKTVADKEASSRFW